MSDPASPLNPPKQPRSKKTLERIVRAALELLEEEGPDGVTVQAVVTRAQSSVGSFYARFGGKDDLLRYLAGRVWEEALERWNAAVEAEPWANMRLAEVVEGAAALLVDVRRSRVERLQDLDWMVGGGNAHERFRMRVVETLQAVFLERESEIVHPEPELAVRLGLSAVLGVVDAAPEEDGGRGLSRDVLARECAHLLMGYLVGGPGDRGGEPVEFFDVWG